MHLSKGRIARRCANASHLAATRRRRRAFPRAPPLYKPGRSDPMSATASHSPVAGSYRSTLLRFSVPVNPPTASFPRAPPRPSHSVPSRSQRPPQMRLLMGRSTRRCSDARIRPTHRRCTASSRPWDTAGRSLRRQRAVAHDAQARQIVKERLAPRHDHQRRNFRSVLLLPALHRAIHTLRHVETVESLHQPRGAGASLGVPTACPRGAVSNSSLTTPSRPPVPSAAVPQAPPRAARP